jgi:hypothetical protein
MVSPPFTEMSIQLSVVLQIQAAQAHFANLGVIAAVLHFDEYVQL